MVVLASSVSQKAVWGRLAAAARLARTTENDAVVRTRVMITARAALVRRGARVGFVPVPASNEGEADSRVGAVWR
jgi:hypothetical protein